MYQRYFKRLFDIIFSLIILILLLPVICIVAVLVRLKLGGPVIFKQERPGLNEEIFMLYKFRTMTNEKDEEGILLEDSKRLTRFGRLLRSTSLDELPELYNILKGDMSFIGPRPLLTEYLPLYNSIQKRRHEVRPGLSGLAQVNGRNSLTWEEKFKYDIDYVDNVTLIQDIQILIMTLKKVIIKEGIDFENNNKSNKFKGSNNQN